MADVTPIAGSTVMQSANGWAYDADGSSDIVDVRYFVQDPSGEILVPPEFAWPPVDSLTRHPSANTADFAMSFPMEFWKPPGQYNVMVSATDYQGRGETGSGSFNYGAMLALDTAQASIGFGTVCPGNWSAPAALTVQNAGNTRLDVILLGTDLKSGGNAIPVENIAYRIPGGSWMPLTKDFGSAPVVDTNLVPGPNSVFDLEFGINVPSGTASGAYTGTLTVIASIDSGAPGAAFSAPYNGPGGSGGALPFIVTIVPEPGTVTLAILGGLGLMCRWRGRRRNAMGKALAAGSAISR